jgi:integrase
MINVDELWNGVARRARQRTELLPAVRAFLDGSSNPHALVLTGRTTDQPCDKSSAEQLEALVIAEYADRNLTKLAAADWLRLLYDAQHDTGISASELYRTRLAAVLPPETSPFAQDAMIARARVELWRDSLEHWIAHASKTASRAEWQMAIALASILYGALLDATKVRFLLEKIAKDPKFMTAGGFAFLDIHLPFQGLGNLHLQRWFVDPISEMLIMRMPASGSNLQPKKLGAPFKAFFKTVGLEKCHWPRSLGDFINSTSTWWSERASRIEVLSGGRQLITHSIHVRSWLRFSNLPDMAADVHHLVEGERSQSMLFADAHLNDDLRAVQPWLVKVEDILGRGDPVTVRAEISGLLAAQPDASPASIYLGWLDFMLDAKNSSGDALAFSTIRRWFWATAPRLLMLLGDDNPAKKTTEVLEDFYSEIVNEPAAGGVVADTVYGLREFHHFLVNCHGRTEMLDVRAVLGDAASLKPVDANLITFDDFLHARQWLEDQRLEGWTETEILIHKLVLTLGFRAGLRRMEIFGLRLEDMHFERGMICVVRPHPERRLKTSNSKRLIPLDSLLSWVERKELKAWLKRRQHEEARTVLPDGAVRSPYVFAHVDDGVRQVSVEGVTDRVCAALRTVTGDDSLFLHHLRHAFGTWVYLLLRAPDYPQLAEMFAHLPETARALKNGRRLRRHLLGRSVSPSRVYAFATARLLGHSGPIVSLGHYIHGSDLVLAALVLREAERIPIAAMVAASGFNPSWAREHIRVSPHNLVLRLREHLFPAARLSTEERFPNWKPRRPGRPVSSPAHQHPDWLPLKRIRALLMQADIESGEEHSVATRLNLVPEQVLTILCQAWRLGPLIGIASDADRLIPCPDRLRYQVAIKLAETLEEKLATLVRKDRELCLRGLDIHLHHYNRQKHDVVFRGKKDEDALIHYIHFLSALGVPDTQIQCIVRRPPGQTDELPAWAEHLNTGWFPKRIKRIAPPTATKAASYGEWLGLQVVDSKNHGLGAAMATTFFLAFLALQKSPANTS